MHIHKMPTMNLLKNLLGICLLFGLSSSFAADKLTIAAAADLKFCMDEIISGYRSTHPNADIEAIYGSSGKFKTQIQQGAPFDLYFSADISFPRELVAEGLAGSEVRTYAIGRIVLWSPVVDASKLGLADLTRTEFRKIAIANPRHAPYGARAEEALRAGKLWEQVEPKLVYGENIAQTAQFVESGNAQIGIIALSLAIAPELAAKGSYALIPADLHQPLEQGYVLTRRATGNALAEDFVEYLSTPQTRALMTRYGFALPGEQLQ